MFNMTPDTMVQWTCNGWSALPDAKPHSPKALSAIQTPDFRFAALAKANEKLRGQLKHTQEKDGSPHAGVEAA